MTFAASMTRFAFVAALAIAAAPALPAQSVGLGVVWLAADHELIHDLTGVELRVGSSVVGSRLAVRLGFGRLAGDQERLGSTCVGIVPVECGTESIHDETRFTRGRGEVSVILLQHGRSSLGLVGGLVVGYLKSDSHGLTSDERLSAEKTVWGADIGGEGRWFFSSSVPIALEAGYSFGGLHPASNVQVADGYAPFEQSFGTRRLRVGAAVELR
jgi:hypothetical protein